MAGCVGCGIGAPDYCAACFTKKPGRERDEAQARLDAIARVIDRGIPDDRKLTVIHRLIQGPAPAPTSTHSRESDQ